MATALQTFSVAFAHAAELQWSFLGSVLFGPNTAPESQTNVCNGTYDGSMLRTTFFLNPFDEHECAGIDWIVLGLVGCIIHAISWWGRWFFWEPLANKRMRSKCNSWDTSARKLFGMTMMSATFFTISAFCGIRILLINKPWIRHPSEWSNNLGDPTVDADFKFFYLLYAARFCSDLVSIFFEDRKKDAFIASLIHHIVTIGLVLLSAFGSYTRIGGVIMLHFDWADPPLLIAKGLKYLSITPTDGFQKAANALFKLFAVMFFLTRNCLFNYVVYIALRDFPNEISSNVCKVFLVVLAGLQTYWFILLVRVVRTTIATGTASDVRDKKKGE